MPTLNTIIGQSIVGVAARCWTSEYGENADYLFSLSRGSWFRFPWNATRELEFSYCELSELHRPIDLLSCETHRAMLQSPISDVFVPDEPELRTADEFYLQLESGLFVFQESGAPLGILPRVGVTDQPGGAYPLVSLFHAKHGR